MSDFQLGINPVRFLVIHLAEGIRLQLLRLATPIVLRVFRDNIRNFRRMFRTKFALGPEFCEFLKVILAPSFGIPSEIEKELDWELHRLQIAYVYDPDAVRPVGDARDSSAPILL